MWPFIDFQGITKKENSKIKWASLICLASISRNIFKTEISELLYFKCCFGFPIYKLVCLASLLISELLMVLTTILGLSRTCGYVEKLKTNCIFLSRNLVIIYTNFSFKNAFFISLSQLNCSKFQLLLNSWNPDIWNL